MTDEEKRVKIAEACGWKKLYSGKLKSQLYGKNPNGKHWLNYAAPDYLNSLDAMHEAEKLLTRSQQFVYADLLRELNPHPKSFNWHCPARQRAEAFGKVMNLW
jgi:hypothetical protein